MNVELVRMIPKGVDRDHMRALNRSITSGLSADYISDGNSRVDGIHAVVVTSTNPSSEGADIRSVPQLRGLRDGGKINMPPRMLIPPMRECFHTKGYLELCELIDIQPFEVSFQKCLNAPTWGGVAGAPRTVIPMKK